MTLAEIIEELPKLTPSHNASHEMTQKIALVADCPLTPTSRRAECRKFF
jgi:hypothetical protein